MPTLTTTMPCSSPRQFVRAVPLPIATQQGLPIQARSQEVYNPCVPSREEVRSINYRRRQAQLTQQGFRSVNYKPYQGIGDPFYLDQRKLILHALGQWNEGDDLGESSCAESSDDDDYQHINKTSVHMTNRSFSHRKSMKGLNTLPKEVGHGRDMIRSVKLGHGLFQLLQRQNEQRTEAKQKELQQKRERMWNEWQPPKSEDDSDSDMTEDDELCDEVDLKRYMVTSSVFEPADHDEERTTTFLTQTQEVKPPEARSVVFRDVQSTNPGTEFGKSTISVNPSSARTSKKNKGPPARPYTPQHSNICADYNRATNKEQREALFRQLCVLYWLLEAMNCNDPSIMTPVTTCWNLKDIGGSKTSAIGKQQKEKAENTWRKFTTNQLYRMNEKPKLLRRNATLAPGVMCQSPSSDQKNMEELDLIKSAKEPRMMPNIKRHSGARHRSSIRRGSALQRGSVSSTPSGSQSQLNLSVSGSVTGAPPSVMGSARRGDHAAIPEDAESVSVLGADEEDKDKFPTKPADDRRESLDPDKASTTIIEEGTSQGDPAPTKSEVSNSRRNSARNRAEENLTAPRRSSASPKRSISMNVDSPQKHSRAHILESLNRSEEDPRLHKLAHPTEKRSSNSYRAEANVRPMSTPNVLMYKASLPSTRLFVLPGKLRTDFDEVTDEKAHTLHDTLEAVDRDRMRKLRGMFVRVPTRTSLHKALEKMRPRVVNPDEEKEKRRRSSLHQQWYIDLTNAIPEEVKEDWFFEKILDKLSKYGMVEASKQSSFKFRRVLKALRDWEVCSPDICAAIEFCREKIVEMPTEEYEEWFLETFPMVARPQTAPPAIKGSKNENRSSVSQKAVVPKSAPPGARVRVH